MKRLHSASNGVEMIHHVDENNPFAGGFELRQDVEPVLREVQRKREQTPDPRSEMRPVAEIPMAVYLRGCAEQWDEADWRRWANDPDNAAFRTTKGRV